MLIKASLEQIQEYKEFAYTLSQDFKTSSFPTYLDTLKTKEDFMFIIDRCVKEKVDNAEILLYKEEDEVLGLIQYYYLIEDKYLGFEIFNVKRNIAKAIDEFLDYIKDDFNEYQIHFGFPFENQEAVNHLEEIGFNKGEDSDVFVLHFKDYLPLEEDDNIVKVNKDNWHDFKLLHDKHTDMYWNSDRLYKALLNETKYPWHMYLYYENDKAIGSIYFTYVRRMMEIFGIDILDNKEIIKPLIIKALNKSKEDGLETMCVFAEEDESKILKEIGLNYICKYVMYWNKD